MPIAQVIKYEGDNSTFVWKHPVEDFNTNSQLIVHESQEAILFMNGQPLDLFGSGRYTLETQNLPILNKIVNILTGGESAFHCEVYFINKVEQMTINWGTDSKIQYMEPTYGFPIYIGAGGEMSLRVQDSKQLLIRLVGTEPDLSRDKLVAYFRVFLMAHVKTYMAQVLKAKKINIFEIDEHLLEFSEELKKRLDGNFADYGISLERFFVTRIVKPDGDSQFENFKTLHYRQYAEKEASQEIENLSSALMTMCCNNFAKFASEDNATSILNNLKLTRLYSLVLLAKCGVSADGFKTNIATKINNAAMDAWNNKIYSDYIGSDGHPSKYQWEHYIQQGDYVLLLLKNAIDLCVDDDQSDVVRYKNMIVVQNKLINSWSYTYSNGGWGKE